MDKQVDFTSSPDDDDWRLQTTARVSEPWLNPWTLETVMPGTRITVVSVIKLNSKKQITIPIPNATALLLNAAARAFSEARAIRSRNNIDGTLIREVSMASDQDAFDYLERMIESIVLAFTALEAFINEYIPADFTHTRQGRDGLPETLDKTAIERFMSIDEKLSAVLPAVLSCASLKGSRIWNDYVQLRKVRDRVVHMKFADRRSSGTEVDTIWRAIFLTSAPHLTVKVVIDHFIKAMDSKPGWHAKYPFGKR